MQRAVCTLLAGTRLLVSAAHCDEGVRLGRGGMRALQEMMDGQWERPEVAVPVMAFH